MSQLEQLEVKGEPTAGRWIVAEAAESRPERIWGDLQPPGDVVYLVWS
jgi:hypothetical protein